MSKMSELDIELHNLFGPNPSEQETAFFMSMVAAMLPNTRINPEMDNLLCDGNEEYIAELELDHIVWVPINGN